MPAYEEEIEEAEKEGVWVRVLVGPKEIVGKKGAVVGVKCSEMALGEFDRTGRRKAVDAGIGDFVVEVDTVIAAIGQAVNVSNFTNGTPIELTRGKTVAAKVETGQTSVPWIFSGGDAMTGPSSVTEAIGAGERAAVGIHQYLAGAGDAFWRKHIEVDTFFDSEADPIMTPRASAALIAVEERKHNFNEVELGFAECVALDESKRCLRCDYREKSGKEA